MPTRLPIASPARIVSLLAVGLLAVPLAALAEASHHQGAAGQVANAVTIAHFASLEAADTELPWLVTALPSYLHATSAFDDEGMSVELPAGSGVENYTLNVYAERRLGARWTVAALTGWQELRLRDGGVTRKVSSVADSFLSVRRSDRFEWGALSTIATLKLPGTYPESALTNAKQVDAQIEVLASASPFRWVSLTAGGGYRLRLGEVQDEVTGTALATFALGERLTVTPTIIGGLSVGVGTVAKNAVTAGAAAAWRWTPGMAVTAGYNRTVYGRNVVLADVVTAGLSAGF